MGPPAHVGISLGGRPSFSIHPRPLRRTSPGWPCRDENNAPGSRSQGHPLTICKPRRCGTGAVVSPDRETRTQRVPADENETFSWTKQWYPIVLLETLEESQGQGYASGVPEVQKQTILGRDIVLWKDSEGKWRAVEDRCAHRLAALSLGSVQEDGTLACRYHGWCFNGRGECTHIPQATDAAAEGTACSSSRSKIQAFPTFEAHGLLWVWPDDSPTAWEDAAAQEPTIGGVSGDDCRWAWIDNPVTYATFSENSQDPIHVLYVHNGARVGPNTVWGPDRALPTGHFKRTSDVTARKGFEFEFGILFNGDSAKSSYRVFRPPCLTSLKRTGFDGSVTYSDILAVPTRPGNSRFFIGSKLVTPGKREPGQDKSGVTTLAAGVVKAIKALPLTVKKLAMMLVPAYVLVGLQHSNAGFFFQDVLTQHSEDVALAKSSGSFQKEVYMPTPSDIGVANFRLWYNKFGGGEPAWFNGGSDREVVVKHTRADIFNRWERHTKWCPKCRKSLKFFEMAEAVLSRAVVVFLGVALLMAAVKSSNPRWAVASAAMAGFALLGRFEAQQFRSKFLTSIPSTGLPEISLGWPS